VLAAPIDQRLRPEFLAAVAAELEAALRAALAENLLTKGVISSEHAMRGGSVECRTAERRIGPCAGSSPR
jgi:hypothetical protein